MNAPSSSDPVMKSECSVSGGETSDAAAPVAGKGNNYQQKLMVKYRGLKKSKKERGCAAKERISKMPPCAAGKRSSIYRGVTRHRWTGRYEAHLWDKSTWNQNQNKKGKQGDDATTESECVGGFCMDRKIDLTPYVKWLGPTKSRQSESHGKSPEETNHVTSEDIGSELKPPEWLTQPPEPYQLPRLGVSHKGKQHKTSSVSAMSILSRSAAYKSLQEKAFKKGKKDIENDENENENKNSVDKMDYGKAVEKLSRDDANEGFGAELGMKFYDPLVSYLSAPLLTNYNSVDPLTDPVFWSSVVPAIRTRSSQPVEETNSESTTDYTFFQQEDLLPT